MLSSFEELCITLAAAGNSFARELNLHGGAYIVIHRESVSFYQNSSVWLDTQDALSRNDSYVSYCFIHNRLTYFRMDLKKICYETALEIFYYKKALEMISLKNAL